MSYEFLTNIFTFSWMNINFWCINFIADGELNVELKKADQQNKFPYYSYLYISQTHTFPADHTLQLHSSTKAPKALQQPEIAHASR